MLISNLIAWHKEVDFYSLKLENCDNVGFKRALKFLSQREDDHRVMQDIITCFISSACALWSNKKACFKDEDARELAKSLQHCPSVSLLRKCKRHLPWWKGRTDNECSWFSFRVATFNDQLQH